MKYSFLTHREEVYPVSLMCRLPGVTRGGYYGHVSRQRNRPEDPVHRAMLDAVVEVARASDSTYGSRRMKRALNALGYLVSR